MYETICEYMDLESQNGLDFQSTIKNICNQIKYYKKKPQICLFVEEIPFEEESEEFKEFVDKVSKMVVYMTSHLNANKVLIVMSSIAIPVKTIEVYGDKVKNAIHFVSMEKWNMDECKSLVNLLSKTVSLQWESEELIQEFIERADFSPRRIKSRLKECCSLEIGTIFPRIEQIDIYPVWSNRT